MEESPIDQTKAGKALYRNGWLVGFLVAAAISIAFLVIFRESYHPFQVMLLVGLPIGVAIGAFAGLAVEGRAISREDRNMIGLSILIGFLLYVVGLIGYLMSRV